MIEFFFTIFCFREVPITGSIKKQKQLIMTFFSQF